MKVAVLPCDPQERRFELEVEQLKSGRHAVTHVEIAVLRSDSDGMLLWWIPRWTELLDGSVETLDLDPDLIDEVNSLRFELAFDEGGKWMGISNEFAVREVLTRFNEAMLKHMNQPGLESIVTPELLLGRWRRQMGTYFGFSGREFEVGIVHHAVRQLPNPLGGEGIEARVSVTAEQAGEGTYLVRMEQRSASRPILEQLARTAGFEFPGPMLDCDLIDLTEATVETDTHSISVVRQSRKFEHPDVDDMEFLEIRKISPESSEGE